MGKRAKKTLKEIKRARRHHADASEALLGAEDVLTELEDRQARRDRRNAGRRARANR